MRQERSDLAQLRDLSREILSSAVTASEQVGSTIRDYRCPCRQLNWHTETNCLACRCSTKADSGVNIGFQPRRDSAGHLCDRSHITRPDLLNQQVSRQLLILPTTIHTQITTNQLPNKGVVSFQLHFSEQLHNLKSAQQEGASSLKEGNENSSCNQPECNQRYCLVENQSRALQISSAPAKEQ